jgi:hypothetical protein
MTNPNQQSPNMALQRTRRPRIRSGRSLRSLGSPLNARPLGGRSSRQRAVMVNGPSRFSIWRTARNPAEDWRLMVGRWLRVAASSDAVAPAVPVAGNLRPT